MQVGTLTGIGGEKNNDKRNEFIAAQLNADMFYGSDEYFGDHRNLTYADRVVPSAEKEKPAEDVKEPKDNPKDGAPQVNNKPPSDNDTDNNDNNTNGDNDEDDDDSGEPPPDADSDDDDIDDDISDDIDDDVGDDIGDDDAGGG